MHQIRLFSGIVILAVVVVVLGVACAEKSHEERVSGLRARYTATLNGFIVQEEPAMAEIPAAETLEGVEVEVAEGEVEVSELDVMEPVVVSKNVMLDILLQHDNVEKLPGVTVDISMVDSRQVEKGHWRVWFDTSTIEKANISQRSHILEEVDYVDGDGFFAEVRQAVPPAERGDYQEFSPPAP